VKDWRVSRGTHGKIARKEEEQEKKVRNEKENRKELEG
jgi:hypothetical protein